MFWNARQLSAGPPRAKINSVLRRYTESPSPPRSSHPGDQINLRKRFENELFIQRFLRYWSTVCSSFTQYVFCTETGARGKRRGFSPEPPRATRTQPEFMRIWSHFFFPHNFFFKTRQEKFMSGSPQKKKLPFVQFLVLFVVIQIAGQLEKGLGG